MNLTKIDGGFTFEDLNGLNIFKITEGIEKITETQFHVFTNNGIIFLDLNCMIENNTYDSIDDFATELGCQLKDVNYQELIIQKEMELLTVYEEIQRLKEKSN
jgi:hypothetical protein